MKKKCAFCDKTKEIEVPTNSDWLCPDHKRLQPYMFYDKDGVAKIGKGGEKKLKQLQNQS